MVEELRQPETRRQLVGPGPRSRGRKTARPRPRRVLRRDDGGAAREAGRRRRERDVLRGHEGGTDTDGRHRLPDRIGGGHVAEGGRAFTAHAARVRRGEARPEKAAPHTTRTSSVEPATAAGWPTDRRSTASSTSKPERRAWAEPPGS